MIASGGMATAIRGALDTSPSHFFAIAVLTPLVYMASKVIYNLFFHPLRKFRGPWINAVSRIPYSMLIAKGNGGHHLLKLHAKYGDVVRVAPNELSFQHVDSWKEIYGHRKGGVPENSKDAFFLQGTSIGLPTIISSNRVDHPRHRSALSHAFSSRAMADQQPIIKQYVDLLMSRLRDRAASSSASSSAVEPVDIVSWYNWCTFDVVGDLAFGQPFGCLEKAEMHPWITVIFDSIYGGSLMGEMMYFPLLKPLLNLLMPKDLVEKAVARREYSAMRVKKRVELGLSRPDFFEAMLTRKGERAFTMEEMTGNADVLIVAGSETTATCLSAATYYAARDPEVLRKLEHEVRSTFKSEDEINIQTVQQLPYMLAVLNESLRAFPPAPGSLPRMTPPQGATVCGTFVPGNTTLSIWQWATYHNPAHWTEPETFAPERWLPADKGLNNARFANDKKQVLNPFSFGPRDCLGKNLAYTEMRLIMARLIFNFDVKLTEQSKDWADEQVSFSLWNKDPLFVHLTKREMD